MIGSRAAIDQEARTGDETGERLHPIAAWLI